nr:uncharacterized protein LOC123761875 [Procambarus clarkii]
MVFRKPVKTLAGTCSLTIICLSVLVDSFHGSSMPMGRYGPLPKLSIINGTDEIIREDQDGFLYCFANQPSGRTPYAVVWTNPYGRPLVPYARVDVNTAKIFTVQERFVLPHSYLVFRGFDESLAGIYACNLLHSSRLIARQTIRLRFFRPSFRVVPLPPCLSVPEGGSVLVPSPVVGKSPRPTVWSRLGSELDPEDTYQLHSGLLLQNVQEPGVYRSMVWLGGGLTHQQDVAVSVLLQDGGGLIQPRGGPVCLPRDDPHPPSKTKPSSVDIANDLIVDIQIHAYRRLVSEGDRKG